MNNRGRSPSPAPITAPSSQTVLPPPPTSAKLPPKPHSSTTANIPYSRQSLGPGQYPSSALNSAGLSGAGTTGVGSRIVSGPPRSMGGAGAGARPVSEILTGGAGGAGGGNGNGFGGAQAGGNAEAEAIDRWFQDLASYEGTLEEMAAASLDQNFTEELGAIEQWFRVLSEAERTAALYSLLQHSTQVQIRFFQTVLQQMSRSDPMTALLSPAGGGGMQSQMDAKLERMGMKSPARASFGGRERESSSGAGMGGGGGGEIDLSAASGLTAAARKLNKASNRISAPGTLIGSSLSPSWAQQQSLNQLDQVLERGPSPSNESERSFTSTSRPKSTDFSGLANVVPPSATNPTFPRSPRASAAQNQNQVGSGGGNGNQGEEVTFPLSPMAAGGNWASMVNTPAIPMFGNNVTNIHGQIENHPAFSNPSSSSLGSGPTVLLNEAPKRRSSANKYGGNGYGDEGDQGMKTQGLRSPGGVGGGFQGAAGNWARSPVLGSGMDAQQQPGGFGGFGLGVGMGGGGFGGVNGLVGTHQQQQQQQQQQQHASANEQLAFQMNQLQLQQLQLQQLQQLQQLGVNPSLASLGLVGGIGGMGQMPMGGGGMGMGMGIGYGMPSLASAVGGGARSASARSGGRRSPMLGGGKSMGGGGVSGGGKGSGEKEEETDLRTLEDVGSWLRSLRLHKYTPNFEGAKWRDMVLMSDADLDAKGVAALGARRKLLKTFEAVRAQYNVPEPESAAADKAKVNAEAAAAAGESAS